MTQRMAVDSSIQRISRLTPLAAILALIEAEVVAVKPQRSSVAGALGYTLAEGSVVRSNQPPHRVALRDGYAVDSASLADAGPYSPLPLTGLPPRVDAGELLPDGADAIVPLDAIAIRGERAEAIAPVVPGEGVLPAGGDAAADASWRQAGHRVRAIDAAVLAAAGIAEMRMRRPLVRVVGAGAQSPPIDTALGLLAHAVARAGGSLLDAREHKKSFEASLTETESDAVIAIGGTGSGRHDTAVHLLARLGRVEAHGIAVSPGETAAFGFVGERPVLLAPGRLDAAAAVWLLLGRHLVARLAGGSVEDAPVMLPLKRKVTSTIGLTELVPVASVARMAEPLASGYLSLDSLIRSDGWIVVPADSEGFAQGTPVAVRPWP
jgi:molybdopterin molybdotransferase